MDHAALLSTATFTVRHSNWLTLQRTFFVGALGLAWLALSLPARAVLPPPAPDGGYPNGNTAEGGAALSSVTTGRYDTAIGNAALNQNTTGNFNTALGGQVLILTTTGSNNTGCGAYSLFSNTLGNRNTATGCFALRRSDADDNTANGFQALTNNTTGHANVATGVNALFSNTSGISNTADGVAALYNNTTGDDNTAVGISALQDNTIGRFNTATGASALSSNTSGNANTAAGLNAMYFNTSGIDNTADGVNALLNNTIGSSNIAIGARAASNLTTGSNNIFIGANVVGAPGDANKIRIGKQGTQAATYVAGIYGKTVASGTGLGVFIDINGKLGTIKSSARYKEQIKPMDKASEAILQLDPVTFRYKQELDPDGVTQFGLIAEQVEKVSSELVVRDEDGKVSTVRYEAVNAMLLNEFLKEHRKVQELQVTVTQQQKEFQSKLSQTEKAFASKLRRQQEQIEALTAGLQKVNDQIKGNARAPRLVAND